MPKTLPPRPDPLMTEASDALYSMLAAGLASPTPGALLAAASMMVAITTAPGVDQGHTRDVVRAMAGQHRPEASAGALAIATLVDDGDLRRWARRDLAARGFFAPGWLAELHRASTAGHALEVTDPFRSTDDLVIGVELPSGHCLSAAVRIDNEIGGRVIDDGGVFEQPVDHVPPHLGHTQDVGVRIRGIEVADARARIEAGLVATDLRRSLTSRTEWENQQPLVRWMLARLPAGGTARMTVM